MADQSPKELSGQPLPSVDVPPAGSEGASLPDHHAVPATAFLDRPLWHWAEVAAALDAPATAGGPLISGVSIDTRTLQPGDLFIALAGDPGPRFFTSSPGNRDGHEFLHAAQTAGAAGALVARSAPMGLPQLRVVDTLDGLWALGRAAAARHRGRRVAITGSSGKTTAKAFLAAALGATAEAGSLNNFWGVPLCLARTPIDAAYAVYEIGTNQAGEIAPLSELVAPEVAVTLNVHPAHIGNFASLDALRSEKISISKGLSSSSNHICEYQVAHDAGLVGQVMTFGDVPAADVYLRSARGDQARYETPVGVVEAQVPGGGRHRALTLGAVIAVLIQLGLAPGLAAALPAALVPKGRGNERLIRRSDGGQWVVVDDSYNANPASMQAALDALADHTGPRFAVVGEMLELGDDSAGYHRSLAERCEPLDGVFCVGKGARVLYEALPEALRLGYADSADAIALEDWTATLPNSGRVLVKGSNRVFWQSGFCARLEDALRR